MRKPREEGRSTRSSGARPRATAASDKRKPPAPRVKPKAKPKPKPKKQGKEVDRPVQVTVIRVRNPKPATKSIIQGGITKQKNQQKKKTASVVGALKKDLLKKLAEKVDDKLSGVVNTLLEVAVVSKKVMPRKKNKEEETVQSSPEKPFKRESSPIKHQIKPKKESSVDTKAELSSLKEERKTSKDGERKNSPKEDKKIITKEDKKTPVKEEKKIDKKSNVKTTEKKATKKSDKKITVKEIVKKIVTKDIKKGPVPKGTKVTPAQSKKKIVGKPKCKGEETNSSNPKAVKEEEVPNPEMIKKDTEGSKKDNEGSKKENDVNKKESEGNKKGNEVSKKDNKGSKKETEGSKKSNEGNKKDNSAAKKDNEGSKKEIEVSKKEIEPIKKDIEISKKDIEMSKKDNEKIAKDNEASKKSKKIKKETVESKKVAASKVNTKKENEKGKGKNTTKPEPKKTGTTAKSKDVKPVVKEEKKQTKRYVKRKPRLTKAEIEHNANINQILNAPKRHREASLNALAKVHCLYENESRGAIMDVINKSEKFKNEERKDKLSVKHEHMSVDEEDDVDEEEEAKQVPARNLRTTPGMRSVGRHWDILNVTSSSSEDSSSDSTCSEKKSIEEPPPSPPKPPEKKVRRRRKRSEIVMDLKDMVVKKRMASLNASAMMAATFSTDKRSSRSDDDSQRKDSDSRESSSTPEVVDVEETSDDEVMLGGGRKKALVIVNQDAADLTITGVYVNSTTRSTRHEGFCSIAGMQYRISSTSHTQTETAVSTETTVIHTEHGDSNRATGSDGGSSCKTYTPLGALSSMQPPGSPRYPPSPSSSAFSAPTHHHPHHQEMHGYFQPAGPLISSSQLKAGPSQVDEMQGASSSQAVSYTTYPPAPPPTAYLEPPGYPHAYPKYPPGYPPRRYFYPSLEAPYPAPYPLPHYYNPYTPPPQPPPHYRPGSYMEAQFQPCPCPMQTCPKNVHTGPLTGTSKGSESNSTVPPVGASRGPVQLKPVALALPPEPNAAANPPSPARGSAGLPPPASPALAQASWGTPPPPHSPGLLTTSLETQPRRKRRRTLSPSPPSPETIPTVDLSEEPPEKLTRPLDRIVLATEKYERLSAPPLDRFLSDRAKQPDRPHIPETIVQSCRLTHPSEIMVQSNNRLIHPSEKIIDRSIHPSEKTILHNDRLSSSPERIILSKNRSIHPTEKVNDRLVHSTEKMIDRSIRPLEKLVQTNRPTHPSDIAQINDRLVHTPEKIILPSDRLVLPDKLQTINRSQQHDRSLQSEKHAHQLLQPVERSLQMPERVVQPLERLVTPCERSPQPDRPSQERVPQLTDRPQPMERGVSQDKPTFTNERFASTIDESQNRLSFDEDTTYEDTVIKIEVTEPRRKRSLSRESVVQSPKRRLSASKRASQPKKLPSPALVDMPHNRSSMSPERKAQKICIPVKNGRRKKELEIKQEIKEEAPLISCPQLKWSNGWSWKGEPFVATISISDDWTEVRKCYPAMEHKEGDVIQPKDCILLKSGSRRNLPFVAKVAALWENPNDGEMMVSLLWYYRPEHTEQGRQPHQPPDEVFASKHKDSNSVACIEDKCYVLTFNEYCRYMKRCRQVDTHSLGWSPVPEAESGYSRSSRMPPGRVSRDLIFFCRKVYDFRLSRILKNPC